MHPDERITFNQQEFQISCEWGLHGIRQLAPHCDALVIVDVLSFCTSVDIAVGRGAWVYPYRFRDESAVAFARGRQALLAGSRRGEPDSYTLSPSSLLGIPTGTRLVLPSLNGASLSMETNGVTTFAGCLRNARAVAQALQERGRRIGVIPAGERWPDGSLRPAIEDLLGAGAIIHSLAGARSPEAAAAEACFLRFREELAACLFRCGSGKELVERGFSMDVELAAELDTSSQAPVLLNGAYCGGIS
jgi:2-phosphosulfolactate phosphatase